MLVAAEIHNLVNRRIVVPLPSPFLPRFPYFQTLICIEGVFRVIFL